MLATKEQLEKLKAAIQKEHDELPEYSYFGTKNDKEGMLERIKLAQWCIDHLDKPREIEDKLDELNEELDGAEDEDYDRISEHTELLDWVLDPENGTYYKDLVGDEK